MSTLWTLLIGAGYLALVAVTLFVIRPRSSALRVDRVSVAVGLQTTPEIEQLIKETQRRELLGAGVSVLIGIVLATAGMTIARVTDPLFIFWIDFTAIMATLGIGSVVATVLREDTRQKSQVRVARLRAVSLADYRSPFNLWMPRIVVVLAIGALILRGAVEPGGYAGVPALVWVYAGVTVLSLALCELGYRIILRSGQPAGSPRDLAWDDALKSRAIASLGVAPFYLGAYFGIATGALFPGGADRLGQLGVLVQLGVSIAAMVLLVVSAATAETARPQQRYLRRLWPELIPSPAATPVQSAAAPQS